MSMVFDILEEERKRLIELKEKYERQASLLPKGTLSRKKRGNREYIYLAYREAGKVRFDYIGPADSKTVGELVDKINQKKEVKNRLRQVNKNLVDVERGLRGKR